jgi:hypothetical protein
LQHACGPRRAHEQQREHRDARGGDRHEACAEKVRAEQQQSERREQ